MSEVAELKHIVDTLSKIVVDIIPQSYNQFKDLTYTCEICNKSSLKCCTKILSSEETIKMYKFKGYSDKWIMTRCGRILHAKCNEYSPVALNATRCKYCKYHELDCKDSGKQKLEMLKC